MDPLEPYFQYPFDLHPVGTCSSVCGLFFVRYLVSVCPLAVISFVRVNNKASACMQESAPRPQLRGHVAIDSPLKCLRKEGCTWFATVQLDFEPRHHRGCRYERLHCIPVHAMATVPAHTESPTWRQDVARRSRLIRTVVPGEPPHPCLAALHRTFRLPNAACRLG